MTDMNNFLTAPRNLALARAAEAMLRTLGGESVSLVFPVPIAAMGTESELGLNSATTEEVVLAPVVVRSLPPKEGRARRELLFAAIAVEAQVDVRAAGSAEALFQSAVGVLHQGSLLQIESVTSEFFGGSAYLYRVVAIE